MENQEIGNGDNTRIYERALEISRGRITELTWNNILFEANLDVKNVEAEERDANVEVARLQLQLQELIEANNELQGQRDDFEEKQTQVSVDYTKLQKLEDMNKALREKINDLQTKLGALDEYDISDVLKKVGQLSVLENEVAESKQILGEANEKLTISDKTSAELIIENNEYKNELEDLRPKVKLLESQAIKGRSSTGAYADLEQEFLKREQKFNEMQQRHNVVMEEVSQTKRDRQDFESALVTQKKLYTELVQKTDKKAEEQRLEIEKLTTGESKPAPKKRGRPRKNNGDDSQDGGVLES